MRAIVIDPKLSGIAGDIFLSALLDLTGEYEVLYRVVDAISGLENCRRINVEVEEVDAGIRARRLKIDLEERRLRNPKDLTEATRRVASEVDLSPRGEKIVLSTLKDLIEAEAKLHGAHFHLHEIASLDTVMDVVGVISVLDETGLLEGKIYATPPALGGGCIKTEHGLVSCPAPATLEILRMHRIPYSNVSVNDELTTPTGAALLANVAKEYVDVFPPLIPERIGYGTGTKRIKGIVNVLRIVEGEEKGIVSEKIVVLETNLDDVSGEVVGHLVNKLLNKGAVDVFVTQALGKKNRPVNVVSVITDQINYWRLLETLIEETGTLGVRIHEVPRFIARRRKKKIRIKINNREFDVTLKYSDVNGRLVNIKPEYEDLKAISEELGVPLRLLSRIVDEKIAREIAHYIDLSLE